MKKFIVQRREVHVSHVEVMAESPEAAIRAVKDGDGDEVALEYSHTPNDGDAVRQSWDVSEVKGIG